jgi:hypothetical protein
VTSYGTNYLVAWADSRGSSTDIYGTRVTAAGAVLDPAGMPLSTAAGIQSAPALAFDGTSVVAAWEDGRNPTTHIYGARWSPSGGLLDPNGIVIFSNGVAGESGPDVAVGGTVLVVWQDRRRGQFDVFGARVASNGTVTDPNGFLVTGGGGTDQAVTKGHGSNWAVSFERSGDVLFGTISSK